MKKATLTLVLFALCGMMMALTLADLDFEDQYLVEDMVISLDTEVTSANFEDFEGIKYEVIFDGSNYIIIRVNGIIYIIEKE